jgi:hypothetical protein
MMADKQLDTELRLEVRDAEEIEGWEMLTRCAARVTLHVSPAAMKYRNRRIESSRARSRRLPQTDQHLVSLRAARADLECWAACDTN